MNYRNDLIAKLSQLEDFARTCFVVNMKLPNGQGEQVNTYIDLFMADLTGGEFSYGKDTALLESRPCVVQAGHQIDIADCLYILLPDCQQAVKPADCYLFTLVKEWIHDNLIKCPCCGCWQLQNDWSDNNRHCENCEEQF